MVDALVVLAFLAGLLGVAFATDGPGFFGVALVGFGCLLAMLARIAQARPSRAERDEQFQRFQRDVLARHTRDK